MTAPVAGLGFRKAASPESLRVAFDLALAASGVSAVTALATAWDKANTPALQDLATALKLPVLAVDAAALEQQPAAQASSMVPARYGCRSLAEAAALAAAGPGARLLAPRFVAPDGMATAAIAGHIPENTSP